MKLKDSKIKKTHKKTNEIKRNKINEIKRHKNKNKRHKKQMKSKGTK